MPRPKGKSNACKAQENLDQEKMADTLLNQVAAGVNSRAAYPPDPRGGMTSHLPSSGGLTVRARLLQGWKELRVPGIRQRRRVGHPPQVHFSESRQLVFIESLVTACKNGGQLIGQ